MNGSNAAGGDVVVAGAGVIGLGIALECARRGAVVRVYDRAEPGRAASWAAAGMLAPYSESMDDPELEALCAASLEEYPPFVERAIALSGVDPQLHLNGTLHVAFDDETLIGFEVRHRALRAREIESRTLDRTQTLAAEPWLGAGVRGAFLVPREGHVDNRRLTRSLWGACVAAGVSIARVDALRVECDSRRVLGVRSSEGFSAARAVVNACGAWAAELDGVPRAQRPPVEPVKGQMLALEAPVGFVRRATRLPGVYVVPRDDGRLLVGATVERTGFDTRVTAEAVHGLLDAAVTRAPALGAFSIGETWAGVRPASPDGRPLIGATRVNGLLAATGHFRNGILLAPITARLVADCAEGRAPAEIGPFSPARFETDGATATRRTAG
ncbi:MAG TPA: glycine oxidase ThiO [Candidatus Acidoferrales bacterium]|nr:glycine oxidase ThiO [Candidatus Acidoferrales bacterium]